jgi:predicted N-formylglutamate amidohydrolase
MTRCTKEHQLLTAEDSLPFEIINNSRPDSPVLIVCDHASNYVPLALNGLGIDQTHLQKHIAYDIGAAGVSRYMAGNMKVMAVLAGFSRLVLDPNRFLTAHDSIPSISDGVVIPGNELLSAADRMLRVEELFIPYHMAINRAITHLLRHFSMPLILSVHSYTPIFQGFERPWEIGVLWEGDDGVASLLIDYLRENTDYHVGENEPYHACNPLGYTVRTHAESNHYPHVLIEIRQDLIAGSQGQMEFAGLLAGALEMIQATLNTVITRTT